jgi:hypothetical protein
MTIIVLLITDFPTGGTMTTFTTFEKSVMSALAELSNNPGNLIVLSNIWENFFPDDYIVPLAPQMLATIEIRTSVFSNIGLALSTLEGQFVTQAYRLIKCLERLHKMEYISYFGNVTFSYLGNQYAEPYTALNIQDHVLINHLRDLSSKRILVHDEMIILIQDNFLDVDERERLITRDKDRKTLQIALWGFLVAAVGLIAGTYKDYLRKEEPLKVLLVDDRGQPILPQPTNYNSVTPTLTTSTIRNPPKYSRRRQ